MQEELIKIGLSENEAKVYLALLEIGSATADEIAKKAGVKRPTTYVQLEGLMKMGLVSSFEKVVRKGGAGKTFFRAEDPDHLSKIVESENIKFKDREVVLKKSLPELAKLFNFSGARPKVRFFEGMEGFKTAQDEFLKNIKSKEVLAISNADNMLALFPEHQADYIPKRVQKGIKSKLIYTSAKGQILKDTDVKMLRESLFIVNEKFPFSVDLVIYDENVQITVLREQPMAIIINDKDMADSMRALFSLIWNSNK